NKTEIVLLITPRVVRNVIQPGLASATQSAGTEASVGAAPLLLGPLPASVRVGGGVTATAPLPVAVAPVASDGALPELSLDVPARVPPGEAFAVSIHVTGATGEGGPLLLAYDTAVVEPLDQPGEGGDALALALPAGASGSITARFRPRPGAAGATSFSVLSAQARIGGQVQSLPTPAPASVQIAP
ncbi:MAG: hypothetical protein KAY13_05820, partial [Zoogloea sp.]|nr:hypothetical protein [Zoogloea sp.]